VVCPTFDCNRLALLQCVVRQNLREVNILTVVLLIYVSAITFYVNVTSVVTYQHGLGSFS